MKTVASLAKSCILELLRKREYYIMKYTLFVYKKTNKGEKLIRTVEYINVSGNFMMDEVYSERIRYGSGYRVDFE